MQNFFDDIFKAIQAPQSSTDTGMTPGQTKQASDSSSSNPKKPVKSDPFTALITSALGGHGKTSGAMPGLDWLGDFDPDSFISGTLAKDRASGSGGDLTKLLGSLIKLI